jgi:fructose-specific phosphotransferase system IIC component
MGEGIGALIGSVLAAWICRCLGDVRVIWMGMIAIGVGLVVYAWLTTRVAAIVVMVILARPVGAVNVAITPVLLRVVPADMLGRAVSVVGPVQQIAHIVSVFVSGRLISSVLLGFRDTVAGITFGRSTPCSPSARCLS